MGMIKKLFLFKEFEDVSKVLNNDMENTDIIVYFKEQLRNIAQEKLKFAKQIVLVGATPFARKVMENKNKLFGGNKILNLADRHEEIRLGGG